MDSRERGYSVPLVLIIVLAILVIPAYFWLSSNDFNFSSSTNIRGASSTGEINADPGFSVSITSSSDTWDLVEYLCSSKSECLSSLSAGKRLGTVSGGQTDLHDVVLNYSDDWKDYEYVKFFVRSGWYSHDRRFSVIDVGDVPRSEVHAIEDGSMEHEVVLVPVSPVSNDFYTSAHFSDRQ